MNKLSCALLGGGLLLALAGCETTSSSAVRPVAETHPVGPAVAPVVATPVATVAVPLKASAAADAAAKRLMESGQPHEIRKTSAFAGFPQFTTQNWSGLVLSSKVSTQSLAHTSNFRILQIEIHPLVDGRVRVWLEIVNSSNKAVTPEVACQFTPEDEGKNAKFVPIHEVGAGQRTVTYFESHEGAPYGYSILARNKRQ